MLALFALIATLNVTYVDTGKTFTLPPKTAIVVTLGSNASTGYHWRLKTIDPNVVRRVSRTYVAPKTSRPGAAGKEIWRFQTVGAGSSPLELVYVPPGRHTKPVRSFSLKINVS